MTDRAHGIANTWAGPRHGPRLADLIRAYGDERVAELTAAARAVDRYYNGDNRLSPEEEIGRRWLAVRAAIAKTEEV